MKPNTLGALCWLLCLQYFAAEALAASAWGGRYDYGRNFISDLGAVGCGAQMCSPWHWLMNASLVAQGLLIVAGALLWLGAAPQGALARVGLALTGASGLGVLAVGLAPSDGAQIPHYLGAAEDFLFSNAGAALLGLALWRQGARWIGACGIAAGLVGLFGLACIAAGFDLGLGAGGVERLTAYPFVPWIALLGAWRLRPRVHANVAAVGEKTGAARAA